MPTQQHSTTNSHNNHTTHTPHVTSNFPSLPTYTHITATNPTLDHTSHHHTTPNPLHLCCLLQLLSAAPLQCVQALSLHEHTRWSIFFPIKCSHFQHLCRCWKVQLFRSIRQHSWNIRCTQCQC